MMHWQLFAKSPNCASHITSALGDESEYPYSKPSLNGKISKRFFETNDRTYTPNSLKEELEMMKLPCLSLMCCNGVYVASFSWSCKTA